MSTQQQNLSLLLLFCIYGLVCEACRRPQDCLNPCFGSRCFGHDNVVCRPYYCDGLCEARWYDQDTGFRIQCDSAPDFITPENTVLVDVCPDPTNDYPGLCLDLCFNCEANKMKCCKMNDCGYMCKPPVKQLQPVTPSFANPTDPPERIAACPPLEPNSYGPCYDRCDNCQAKGQLCCSNGCGRECMEPIRRWQLAPSDHLEHISGQCPTIEPGTVGVCSELCNDCVVKSQLCCFNGCGRQCMTPVFPTGKK